MTTIGLTATDQLLSVTLNPKVTSGQENTVELHVDFSDDWSGFAKSAVFFTTNDTSTVYEKVLTSGDCIIPAEAMERECILYIGVRGVNSETNQIKTTSLVKYKISQGSPAGTGTEVEPTPNVYQQLLSAYGSVDKAISVEKQARELGDATEKSERQAEIAVERSRIDNISSLGQSSVIEVQKKYNASGDTTPLTFTLNNNGKCVVIIYYHKSAPNTVTYNSNVLVNSQSIFAKALDGDAGTYLEEVEFDGHAGDIVSITRDNVNVSINSVLYVTKEATDTELTDIRVGADGTIYPCAGDAVRSQVGELKDDIDSQVDALKSDIDELCTTIKDGEKLVLRIELEQGGISLSDGTNDDSVADKRIRSALFAVEGDYIWFATKNGYQMMVHYYQDGIYKDRTGWITEQKVYNRYNGYRIQIKAKSGTNIAVSDYKNMCEIYITPVWTDRINKVEASVNSNTAKFVKLDTVVYENTAKCYNHLNIGNGQMATVPSYDGSGQTTHPKILYFADGWNGYKWWLGVTPYPNSNDDYENPQVCVSNDGVTFEFFNGCPNPLFVPEDVVSGGHYSDIHLCLKDGTMYCFWRYNPAKTDGGVNNAISRIYESHSTDGKSWSVKRVILNENTFSVAHAFYSPVFNWEDNKWKIWFTSEDVDLGLSDTQGHLWYMESADLSEFTNPIMCEFGNAHLIRMWHQDIVKVDDGYDVVCCGYKLAKYDFKHQKLYTAHSEDGIHFEQLREFMHPCATSWDNKSLYRPTFCVVDGVYHLFYSASTLSYDGDVEKDGEWGIGHSIGNNLTSVVGLKTNGKKLNNISLVKGQMIFDSELGCPLWRNAPNKMWVNSVGQEIDKYWAD